jgi:hypothetical protein
MELTAPIYELKRKAKQLRREKGLKHSEALNCVANEEGFTTWSLLIHKYEDQKPKPIIQDRVSFEVNSLQPARGAVLAALSATGPKPTLRQVTMNDGSEPNMTNTILNMNVGHQLLDGRLLK